MKKWTVLLSLLMVLALAGCGGSSEAGEGEEGTGVQKGISAAVGETEAQALTETEVLSAYDRAVNAYGWFDLTPLPCTQQQEMVDGWLYQRVDYAGIEDMADLRAYLQVVFSPELTERLLERGDHPVYRDVDGALYAAADAGRERESGTGSVSVEVIQESSSVYSVEVTVELLDTSAGGVIGVECYAFPYEFVEGKWVFTDFQLVY